MKIRTILDREPEGATRERDHQVELDGPILLLQERPELGKRRRNASKASRSSANERTNECAIVPAGSSR